MSVMHSLFQLFFGKYSVFHSSGIIGSLLLGSSVHFHRWSRTYFFISSGEVTILGGSLEWSIILSVTMYFFSLLKIESIIFFGFDFKLVWRFNICNFISSVVDFFNNDFSNLR